MEPTPLDDLAAHAHETHVVVVGGGIGGLVAALACAKVGIRVTVLEASDRLGGAVRTVDLAGLRVDVGAEGYATRGGAVRGLVDELDLTDAVVPTAPRAEWISGLPGGAAPVPEATVRGIPENPWDDERPAAHRPPRHVARVPRPTAPAAHDRPGAQPRKARAHAHGRARARSARRAAQPRRLLDPPRRRRRRAGRARAQRRAHAHRIARRGGDAAARRPGSETGGRRARGHRRRHVAPRRRAARSPSHPRRRGPAEQRRSMHSSAATTAGGRCSLAAADAARDRHRRRGDRRGRRRRSAPPARRRRPRAGADPRHRARGRDARRRSAGPRRRTGAHRGLPRARHGGCGIRHRLDRALAVAAAAQADRRTHVLKVAFGGPGAEPATAALDDRAAAALALAEASALLGCPWRRLSCAASHRAR